MDNKKIVIAKNVKSYFEENNLLHIYNQLNIIISKITNFNEKEMIMVVKTKNQSTPYSITLFCNGLESDIKATISFRFGYILNNQSYKVTNPLLEVDEESSDLIYQYTLEIDNQGLIIYPVLRKEKKSESGYHYYK